MKNTARPILFAFFAAVISLLMAQPARADTCTINWNTDASGSWTTAANWDANRVPDGADHACINRPSADPQVTIPAGYTATLASLVNRDYALQLNGALVVTGTGSVLASPVVVDRCTGVLDVKAGATLDLEGETADFTWSNYCSSALLKVSGMLNKTGGGTSSFTTVGLEVRGGALNAVNGTLSVSGARIWKAPASTRASAAPSGWIRAFSSAAPLAEPARA